MNKITVPTDSREAEAFSQLFQLPSHLNISRVDIKSPTLKVLTLTSTADPFVMFRITVSAIDGERFSVEISEILEFTQGGFTDEETAITFASEFLREKVGSKSGPFLGLFES